MDRRHLHVVRDDRVHRFVLGAACRDRNGVPRTLRFVEVLPDRSVRATYASGRSFFYADLAELLRSHRLSPRDFSRTG